VGFDGVGHSYGAFNGVPQAATLDTGESAAPAGMRWFANSARPIIDLNVPVATVQTMRRDQLMGGTLTTDTAVPQEITGECPILADARYMRMRVQIPHGAFWQHARGVELWRKETGRV